MHPGERREKVPEVPFQTKEDSLRGGDIMLRYLLRGARFKTVLGMLTKRSDSGSQRGS